jgi:bis(5'-nucleosyl)-tetraphosphatase (symmetrical)
MRRIFVGDIQGCLAQLEDLLEATHFRREVDVLHPLGDMVNKGPDSHGVLRLLMELDAEPVIGNHDLRWLELVKSECEDPAIRQQTQWLRSQPVVRLFDDVIAVHAGLHPNWTEKNLTSLTEEQKRYAITVRYCDPEGNKPPEDWPPPHPPYLPWYHYYHGDKRVLFGHWARQGLYVTDKVIGLDSGCVYGGKLSAWIAEEDRIVQVPGWRSS